ncbi:helix-turn-helix domain-containing protein [Mycolicibacterium aubagnense]|uniref:HTH cro/C1-type domain-containing protein n=1 Tax=Mycolicibacterium aubagnense TaxID=319707 RepID=A0ABM7IJE0_9MYCO|nr:hypothetical protein [Mycolicibacterium aubagnense]WGI31611.1 hypothetical protein QDT91_20620 [Mycolicibacterium aubagnense]BBX86920.1 hypothetical protein MAUB_47930 [Mycolicibacterium aubagnense]
MFAGVSARQRLYGMRSAYFGAVERGERNLTLKTLERIAEFVGVDQRDLLNEPRPD